MSENNNIENLVREKAEKYDIYYREEDWQKLETRLDTYDQGITDQHKRWAIAAAVILFLSLFGYMIFQNYQEINQLNEQLDEQNISEVEVPQNNRGEDTSDSQSSQAGSNINSPDNSRNDRSEKSSDQSATGSLTVDTSASDTEASEASKTGRQKISSPQKNTHELSINSVSCNACELVALSTAQERSATPSIALSEPIYTDPYLAKENTQKNGASFIPDPHSAGQSVPQASVAIMMGPDLSTVSSLSDFQKPGFSIGMSISYRLSSNFSIRGGLVHSTVHYAADGTDYRPPSEFWTYGTIPNQTTAECAILDIPISVKYNFWNFNRSRLYAAAGVSSYIMLSEEYYFDYGEQNSRRVQEWSGKTGSRHWLSNADISIGYEFNITPRLSLQAESVLKLPMKDVGWGQVKLYSLGSFISFSYSIK